LSGAAFAKAKDVTLETVAEPLDVYAIGHAVNVGSFALKFEAYSLIQAKGDLHNPARV
jgi:hypothetical protein